MAKKPEMRLLTAVKFARRAQKRSGDVNETHIRLANGYAVGFNNIVACGHPIDETTLNVCPESRTLVAILDEFEDGDTITQQDNETFVVKTEGARTSIPCANPAALTPVAPNAMTHLFSPEVMEEIRFLGLLVKSNASTVIGASLKLDLNSFVVSNLEVIVEYWHGLSLPYSCLVPADFLKAIKTIKQSVVGIGYGENQLTIHYDQGCWARTQLYTVQWPDTNSMLASPEGCVPLPALFFTAVGHVINFNEDDLIYLSAEGVHSHQNRKEGATYALPGLPDGVVLHGRSVYALRRYVTHVKFSQNLFGNVATCFFGEKVRASAIHVL